MIVNTWVKHTVIEGRTGMLNNISISFVISTGGSIDTNGNPVAPTKTSSTFVKCNLAILQKHYTVQLEGEEIRVKYSIIVDEQAYISLALANIPTQAEIKDSEGISYGVHKVHQRFYMPITKKYKFLIGIWD